MDNKLNEVRVIVKNYMTYIKSENNTIVDSEWTVNEHDEMYIIVITFKLLAVVIPTFRFTVRKDDCCPNRTVHLKIKEILDEIIRKR